jgi:hypothetical protein
MVENLVTCFFFTAKKTKTKTKPETSSLIKTPDDPKKEVKGIERVAMLVTLIEQIFQIKWIPLMTFNLSNRSKSKDKTRHFYREA